MTKKATRIHRPRIQTPEQEAAEQAIRQKFQEEKPTLEDLVERGDITQVFTMGEYWELRKTLRRLESAPRTAGFKYFGPG